MTRVSSLRVVLAILVTVHGHGSVAAETDPTNATNATGTFELVHNIRRQLMADNYDYMSTENEEPFPNNHELDNAETTTEEPETLPTPPDYDTTVDLLGSHVNDIFIPRSNVPSEEDLSDIDSLSEKHGIAKNDLLYYIDDDRLKRERVRSRRVEAHPENGNENIETTPKVKYKFLKMRQPETAGGGRRAAGAGPSFRQFLEEENGDGVVIINLDNEPFPEFRLPSARRQYMSGEHPAELEIAPLSDLSEEMVHQLTDI